MQFNPRSLPQMIIIFYFLTLLGLLVYSYSQIDLNLTLLQTPWFLWFQNAMIQLGYFSRPLSTIIFTSLIVLLFIFYWKLPALDSPWARPGRIRNWKLVFIGVGLLALLSYPAFSHDFFNYLFDARIVTHYGQNPYFLKALDFPADSWVRFMHWTHRTYPYGPVWLLISLAPSLLGLGKFILTVLNFKILFVGAYLICCYIINKLTPKNLWLFALSPLVIIEGLVSPHLDLVMLAFALLAVHRFRWLNLLLSIGVKFSTLTLVPIFFFSKKKWFYDGLIIASYLGALIQVFTREILPHYFLVPLGFSALSNNKKWHYLSVVLSLILLLFRYLPFLYTGEWVTIKLWSF
jgi:hypothetical protein